MSGHSKWATIKHKKGAADQARAKVFAKIARQLEVAARDGGGDPSTNATLRTMVLKGKAASMNNDLIDRAIKRGTGEAGGGTYEAITYEGYAPGGVALLIDVLTDNRNRSGSDVRNVFSKLGGSMAEPGAVSWQFSRKAILIARGSEDEVMMVALEAGAEDIADEGDGTWRITAEPSSLHDLRDAILAGGIEVVSADTTMVPSLIVEVTDVADAKKVLRIIDALEDNDDVQDVYGNFDISDEIMEDLDA